MKYTSLQIEYANPINLDDTVTLTFKLRDHQVANRWANKVAIAQKKYAIDAPGRFYGFGVKEEKIKKALTQINTSIDIINSYKTIIDRHLTDINDQDTLNYLHHIFEVYHGLLDQQNTEFWNDAPTEVQRALSDLNIQVHECEQVSRSDNNPTNLITWYNLPKIDVLRESEYSLFEDYSTAGTAYLMYVEIGKTLEDLAIDNDKYIFDSAFMPFRHCSADFLIKYYTDSEEVIERKRKQIKEYYESHSEFFLKRNLEWGHPYLSAGFIPLADAINFSENTLDLIKNRQWVKSIIII